MAQANASSGGPRPTRLRIEITGVVQGVGFRPFVHHLATSLGLDGWVVNGPAGVVVELEGPTPALDAFLDRLRAEPPPLAVIHQIRRLTIPPTGIPGFRIEPSDASAPGHTPISPDIAPCDDCLRELFDPSDRRYRYPFLNCTNCGPRFTITLRTPYDRATTTMARFALCDDCAREYADPADRRYHAQPTACPACGPRLWWVPRQAVARALHDPDSYQGWTQGESALQATLDALAQGQIVAIKGVGGFHLGCDATSSEAVLQLRARKGRPSKPFALLVRSLHDLLPFARPTRADVDALQSRARPITLIRRTDAEPSILAEAVAPGCSHLGIMLPHSPLQYLIAGNRPLVMTSGNLSEEPIARQNREALERLAHIVDGFLLHDRDIHVSCDDSVVASCGGSLYPVRRARGYAPMPVPWPALPGSPVVLAVGGDLKSAFFLGGPERGHLSQHLGDLGQLASLDSFQRTFDQFRSLFRLQPEVVACDLHPDYLSSHWARRFARSEGLPLVTVQHHHAHLASILTEHQMAEGPPVLGMVLDGTGLGLDETVWGCELLLGNAQGFERVGHLRPIPMPGGDASTRRPYRSALAHLHASGIPWRDDLPCVSACPAAELRLLARQLETAADRSLTTSAGRLFDAVSSLLGLCHLADHEARAAVELETAALRARRPAPRIPPAIADSAPPWILDPSDFLHALLRFSQRGTPAEELALAFHHWLADGLVEIARRAADHFSVHQVALTGGVFQNKTLLRMTRGRLQRQGFTVLVHRLVPPNDGGLALGQAAVALAGSSTAHPPLPPTSSVSVRRPEP